ACEIGAAPFAGTRVLVELTERIPLCRADLRAAKRFDLQAFHRRRPFPADLLAPAAGGGAEKMVEGAIAAIEPVELDGAAEQSATGHEFRHLRFVDEGGMGRGQAVLGYHGLEGGHQRLDRKSTRL